MNYLITGGAGFLGSHLVDRLLNNDNEITVIDGHSPEITVIDNFSHGKYKNLPKDPRLTVYDVNILGDIEHLFRRIDIVFHLAALTRPQWSMVHPYEVSEVNVLGTLRILEYSRDHKIKRVVFASSSDLYGNQDLYPTPEDVKPNPLNFYALTKYIGEQYCELFYKLYGLEYNIIRPFNAYGPRMPITGIWTSAVATFIDALKNDKPFKTFGTGEQRRDFVYVDDIIDQMILMTTSKAKNEAFNCGSGTNNSINEIREMVEKIMGKHMAFERLPGQFEKKQTLADISKAKRLLGWQPKIGLEEGLRRIING